jgi:hypothetical protein
MIVSFLLIVKTGPMLLYKYPPNTENKENDVTEGVMSSFAYTAVLASTETGKSFVQTLIHLGIPFIHVKDMIGNQEHVMSKFQIERVYLFEDSLAKSCEFIQLTRKWTKGPLYVITSSKNPTSVFKKLGADYVIYTQSKNVDFLIG